VAVSEGTMEELGVESVRPGGDFWCGRRVLLTGHSGFKGSWLSIWLHRLGAEVTGVSLAPTTRPNLYELADVAGLTCSHFSDIRDIDALRLIVARAEPEIIFHLAAQPLVRAAYDDPVATFATNVQGTAHVLEAARHCPGLRVVVAVTTDKVYDNIEHGFPFRETDPLGGHDPYSASKAAAELVIACYRKAFLAPGGVAVASARAGNAIGGGDWSADRLIPDAVRAWTDQTPLQVRRPDSVRPWQHVLEPLAAYLRLAQLLWRDPALAGAYNFGPDAREVATVREVVEIAQAVYGGGAVVWGVSGDGPREAYHLRLENSRARARLRIQPRWTLHEALQRTMAWYSELRAGAPARALCDADISAYELALEP
jgi:CDP-glucose 4,6-dehydratase